jgi:hypothetical protein
MSVLCNEWSGCVFATGTNRTLLTHQEKEKLQAECEQYMPLIFIEAHLTY